MNVDPDILKIWDSLQSDLQYANNDEDQSDTVSDVKQVFDVE